MTISEFNKSVDKYSDNLFRFILKNVKDEDKAKDIVQESYIKLWNKIEDVSVEKVKPYLFKIAYHTMIDMIRREKKIVGIENLNQSGLTTHESYFDTKEILEHAINKLPETQKTVILLRDYEGYSYDEIGEITGLNESQVKVYIYRARVFLKDYLKSVDTLI